MKVQCLNSSSVKTRNLIKNTFVELMNEKKQLDKITVTELVKRAQITRSTFYTHYDNIYDIAKDYQLQTIELLTNENLELHSKQEIENYFDEIIKCLKENEDSYKMLLSADEPVSFLDKLRKMATQKIYFALKDNYKSNKYLELDVSFFMDAIMMELLKYFRDESDYSLDELLFNTKKWFEKIFN